MIIPKRVVWGGVFTWLLYCQSVIGQTPAPHPHLVCDQALFDYGVKPNTVDVDHVFTIRNTGDAPLVISQVRSGCGCTQAKLSQNTIEPGSNAVLSARLSLRGVIGAKRTSIYLHSNDPGNPVFQCQLSGSAVIDLSVSPAQITFTYSPLTTPAEQHLIVTSQAGSTNRITAVESQGAFFRAAIATNAPGYGVVVVTPATNTPPETLQGMIIISTDHPRFPQFTVPIQSLVAHDINAYPSEITLGDEGHETPDHVRYIILRGFNDQPFNITNVVVIPPSFPARLHSMKPTWAKLKVGPIIPETVITGAIIRIYTDTPGSAPLDIPVKSPVSRKATTGVK